MWTKIKSNIGLICTIIVVCLGAYAIGTCHSSNTWQDKYKTYYDSTQTVLANYTKSQQQLDSLQKISTQKDSSIARLNQSVNRLMASANRLQTFNDSLMKQVVNIQLPPIVRQLIDSLHSENLTLRSTIDTLKAKNDTLQQKNIVLQHMYDDEHKNALDLSAQLKLAPKPENDKFLGLIKLPSRTTCLLLGIGAGIVVDRVASNIKIKL